MRVIILKLWLVAALLASFVARAGHTSDGLPQLLWTPEAVARACPDYDPQTQSSAQCARDMASAPNTRLTFRYWLPAVNTELSGEIIADATGQARGPGTALAHRPLVKAIVLTGHYTKLSDAGRDWQRAAAGLTRTLKPVHASKVPVLAGYWRSAGGAVVAEAIVLPVGGAADLTVIWRLRAKDVQALLYLDWQVPDSAALAESLYGLAMRTASAIDRVRYLCWAVSFDFTRLALQDETIRAQDSLPAAAQPAERCWWQQVPRVADTFAGCDKGDMSSSVRRQAVAIRECYEKELGRTPDLFGKLVVQWTILSDGSVGDLAVQEDTLQRPSLAKCVLDVIRGVRFLPPKGGKCVVQWPFVFNPG